MLVNSLKNGQYSSYKKQQQLDFRIVLWNVEINIKYEY